MSEREKRVGYGRSARVSVSGPGRQAAPSMSRSHLTTASRSQFRVLDQAFAELSHHTTEDAAATEEEAPAAKKVARQAPGGDQVSIPRPATPTIASPPEQAGGGEANIHGPQQAVASRMAGRLDARR